ncbi:MAG: FAD:protein FMN transferase [Calditrichaeota bacterium]|nr:MAG: FAD:protein FMN transferase [Calditrichota bacterium]
MMRFVKKFLLITFFLGGLFRCQHDQQPVSRTEFLLGTYVTITSYDIASEIPPEQAIDSAFAAIRLIEKVSNPFDTSSIVTQLNLRSAQERKMRLPSVLAELVQRSMEISRQTQGQFDFTLWPVYKLWHFGTDSATVPPENQITEALLRVGWERVHFSPPDSIVLQPGVELDFGGIHKGFAVEKARLVLKKMGLQNFIIDAGGNLAIEWHRPDSVRVFVRHPRQEGKFIGMFPIYESCGIATSGDYQFYFMQNGKRYHHILNPQTGYPAEGVVSVSIVAPNAILADGFSTAVFVMGKLKGMAFIESHPELEGLIIFEDGGKGLQTQLSTGLRTIFKQTNYATETP